MATLVTGGTGFVGSNIVRTLAQSGHSVICLDLAAPGALVRGYLEPWMSKVTFVQGDILDPEDVERAAAGIDKIVHAAVFTGILPEIEKGRSRSIVDINLMGTTNLLELARQLSVERFIYVSSGSVYGDDPGLDEVLHEETPPNPRSLYAIGKYTSELLTRRYGELHGFQTASVRLGGPYGPMERVTGHRANQSLLKEWTGNVVRGEPIEVGDRTVKRSFTYVSDIAAGVCAVLDAPALSYDVYNNS
ncbi:MAG: NAD(P)-dependent oxidoreductase, partial [Chloroflexi bacterium]|nr:NAD(P)-dependent oxidoreductase [Chloroflexota bacterium]